MLTVKLNVRTIYSRSPLIKCLGVECVYPFVMPLSKFSSARTKEVDA